jgi:outer membrane protein assembly factor BamB
MTPERGFNRREFLPRAAAGLAAVGAAGVAGYELHGNGSHGAAHAPSATAAAAGSTGAGAVQRFVTRPDLLPPAVRVTNLSGGMADDSLPRFIFIAPYNYFADAPSAQGLMIVDREGRVVWFQPVTSGEPFDLNAQSYDGRSVLTWWRGKVLSAHGLGVGEMADSSYRTIEAIHAGDGLKADLHELNLTSAGTALVTAYEATTTSLAALGGSRQGKVFAGLAQEIDVATGKVLFDWNSLKHVGVGESYQALPASEKDTFDYFHINSIAEMEDGNLLISGRNTCALYKVDRSSGQVLWRMNGKRSDFSFSAPARFYWQHHARAHGAAAVTVFDNAGAKEKPSRALLLSLDTKAKQVNLTQAYVHPAAFLAETLGSVQLLPDGRVFVGWGDQPYFSEFAPDGTLLLDGQLPFAVRSYRAFVADWSGNPSERPRVAAHANPAGGFVVYASWNGATEIDRWTVLAGQSSSSLTPVGSQQWTDFETAIAVNSTGPWFCAVALDANGKELGRSEVI